MTHGGTFINLLAPNENSIHLDDIAHALSNICRFTGHVHKFYSVAQHSVIVSRLVTADNCAAALLHDAAEAYIGDVSSPLKAQLSVYKQIEAAMSAAICRRFNLYGHDEGALKNADMVALATERRDLFRHLGRDMPRLGCLDGIEPLGTAIDPLPPYDAYKLFIDRAHELGVC